MKLHWSRIRRHLSGLSCGSLVSRRQDGHRCWNWRNFLRHKIISCVFGQHVIRLTVRRKAPLKPPYRRKGMHRLQVDLTTSIPNAQWAESVSTWGCNWPDQGQLQTHEDKDKFYHMQASIVPDAKGAECVSTWGCNWSDQGQLQPHEDKDKVYLKQASIPYAKWAESVSTWGCNRPDQGFIAYAASQDCGEAAQLRNTLAQSFWHLHTVVIQ